MFAFTIQVRHVAAVALACAVAGCSAGHQSPGAFIPATTGAAAQPAAFPAQPDGGSMMYVVDFMGNEILGFPSTAHGNVAPAVVVGGSKTKLDQPAALAIDSASGKIFVANGHVGDHRILIFPKNADGNVAPQVLAGSNVPIQSTEGLAVDASGKLFVSDYVAKAIYVFAAGATGNTAPIRTISGSATKLVQPYGMSFDSAGHLYVANGHDSIAPIEEFAAGANGNVAPIATIGGSHTKLLGVGSISVDKQNRIVVADGGAIDVFAAGAHGNVAPVHVIKGSATTIADVYSVGTDAQSTIYGTNAIDISHDKFSIVVFASNADGNVAPLRVLAGSHTHIKDPQDPTFF